MGVTRKKVVIVDNPVRGAAQRAAITRKKVTNVATAQGGMADHVPIPIAIGAPAMTIAVALERVCRAVWEFISRIANGHRHANKGVPTFLVRNSI